MNSLAVAIVHPDYEHLKRLGRSLHFIAGLLIISSAIQIWQQPHPNQLYAWCLFIVGLDILAVVFINRNLAQDQPRVNMVFRLIEFFILQGAMAIMIFEKHLVLGLVLQLVASAYGYLFYCERQAAIVETVAFHHTGISISGIPRGRFFIWSHINRVDAHYDRIVIDTSSGKTFHFDLRHNLTFEELGQIHEFCRHYLGE